MSQLSQPLYDGRTRQEWFDELRQHDPWMRRHLLSLFGILGMPDQLLEFGCGTGIIPILSAMLGVRSFGVDQLIWGDDDSPYVQIPEMLDFFEADLRHPFSLSDRTRGEFSHSTWVISLETAEHIPNDGIIVFCDTLANHVGRGGLLFFSAAHPGQSGSRHLSDKPAKYWRDEFHTRGMNFKPELTSKVIAAWGLLDSPLYWLLSNLQIFER